MLERGIPSSALNFLLSRVKVLEPAAVRKAVGLSVRLHRAAECGVIPELECGV